MNTPPELIEALSLIKEVPQPTLEYRIHYDDKGFIIGCTMSEHPNNSNYVVVDRETYDNYFRYDRVINGKLRKIIFDPGYRIQLYPSNSGYLVVKDHAALLIEENETYDNTEFYSGEIN
jgi:hypothetical protein